MDEQTALSHAAKVPSSVMREILLNGTPDEVIDQAAQWRDSGVRYMVLINVSFIQPSLRKGLAAIRPFNKIVRGLKEALISARPLRPKSIGRVRCYDRR